MQTNKMIEKVINGMNDKIETLENKINNIFDLLKSGNIAFSKDIPDIDQETTETIKLNERYDELESKYFTLLSRYDNLDSKINSVFDILKGVVVSAKTLLENNEGSGPFIPCCMRLVTRNSPLLVQIFHFYLHLLIHLRLIVSYLKLQQLSLIVR